MKWLTTVAALLLLGLAACDSPATNTAGGSTARPTATSIAQDDASDPTAVPDLDLPDVADDESGMTVTVSAVEAGFSADAVPLRLNTLQCFGGTVQWIFEDETGNAGPFISLTLALREGLRAGSYPLETIADEDTVGLAINVQQVNSPDSAQFVALESGLVRFDSVPTAAGQRLSGAFEANLRPSTLGGSNTADPNQAIRVQASFSVSATDGIICPDD